MKKAPQLSKLEQFFSQFNSHHLYQKGKILLRADDNPSGVFYLAKGFARLYGISPEGQEITFNIFKPGTLKLSKNLRSRLSKNCLTIFSGKYALAG